MTTSACALPCDVADLQLDYESTQELYWVGKDEDQVVAWSVSVTAPVGPDYDEWGPREQIGHLRVVQVNDEAMGSPFDVLDNAGADLSRVADVLLGVHGDQLEEYREEHDSGGYGFVVLDSVTLVQSWRGFGVGALLAGLVLQRLARDFEFVVVDPAPAGPPGPGDPDRARDIEVYRDPEYYETEAHAAAVAKLTGVWAGLGFEPFADGFMVLNPSRAALGNAVAALRAKLQASRRSE